MVCHSGAETKRGMEQDLTAYDIKEFRRNKLVEIKNRKALKVNVLNSNSQVNNHLTKEDVFLLLSYPLFFKEIMDKIKSMK